MSARGIEQDTWTCPDWYIVMQVAKYLNVAPWDLLRESIWWTDHALMAMSAENSARKQLEQH